MSFKLQQSEGPTTQSAAVPSEEYAVNLIAGVILDLFRAFLTKSCDVLVPISAQGPKLQNNAVVLQDVFFTSALGKPVLQQESVEVLGGGRSSCQGATSRAAENDSDRIEVGSESIVVGARLQHRLNLALAQEYLYYTLEESQAFLDEINAVLAALPGLKLSGQHSPLLETSNPSRSSSRGGNGTGGAKTSRATANANERKGEDHRGMCSPRAHMSTHLADFTGSFQGGKVELLSGGNGGAGTTIKRGGHIERLPPPKMWRRKVAAINGGSTRTALAMAAQLLEYLVYSLRWEAGAFDEAGADDDSFCLDGLDEDTPPGGGTRGTIKSASFVPSRRTNSKDDLVAPSLQSSVGAGGAPARGGLSTGTMKSTSKKPSVFCYKASSSKPSSSTTRGPRSDPRDPPPHTNKRASALMVRLVGDDHRDTVLASCAATSPHNLPSLPRLCLLIQFLRVKLAEIEKLERSTRQRLLQLCQSAAQWGPKEQLLLHALTGRQQPEIAFLRFPCSAYYFLDACRKTHRLSGKRAGDHTDSTSAALEEESGGGAGGGRGAGKTTGSASAPPAAQRYWVQSLLQWGADPRKCIRDPRSGGFQSGAQVARVQGLEELLVVMR